MRFLSTMLGAALLALAWGSPSWGTTFTGSGTNSQGQAISASADFSVLGKVLTIDLKNTATFTTNVQNVSVLTGLFFDTTGGSPTFAFTSAALASGSTLISTNPGTVFTGNAFRIADVNGGWDYANNSAGLGSGITQAYGLGTAGFNIFSGTTSTGDGAPTNYGVIQSGSLTYHDGLTTNTPLIQNTIQLVLTASADLSGVDFKNVRFQYGTALDEGSFSGGPPNPPVGVPEPSTLAIAGLGALGLFGYGLRRRRAM